MQGNRMLLPRGMARQDRERWRLLWNGPPVSLLNTVCSLGTTHTTSTTVSVTVTGVTEVDTTVVGTTVVAVMVVVDWRKVEQNELAASVRTLLLKARRTLSALQPGRLVVRPLRSRSTKAGAGPVGFPWITPFVGPTAAVGEASVELAASTRAREEKTTFILRDTSHESQ